MSSKMTNVLEGLFGPKTICLIYFWKPLVKSRSMMMTPVIFDSNQGGMMILMSSKVTDVLDKLFGWKTLCIIYFWKPLVKYSSMMMALVIFDSNQDG